MDVSDSPVPTTVQRDSPMAAGWEERIHRLRSLAAANGLDAVVLTSPENTLYAAGVFIPSLVDNRDRPVFAVIPLGEAPFMVVPDMEYALAVDEGLIESVIGYQEFDDDAVEIMASCLRTAVGARARVGVETDHLSARHHSRLSGLLPEIQFLDCGSMLKSARALKTPDEIEMLADAARAAEKAHLTILEARHGQTENEIAARITVSLMESGVKPVFPLVVASGRRSFLPNGAPSDKPLELNDVLRVDIFGEKHGYLSDIARTSVVGTPTRRQIDTWRLLVELHLETMDLLRPGMNVGDLYRSYARRVAAAGFEPLSFLGHGLGLTFHEDPIIADGVDQELKPGMVICTEPYVTVPEEGWGMQLEDTFAITEDGYRALSSFQPFADLVSLP